MTVFISSGKLHVSAYSDHDGLIAGNRSAVGDTTNVVTKQDHCGKYEQQTRVLRLKRKYAISLALQVSRGCKD